MSRKQKINELEVILHACKRATGRDFEIVSRKRELVQIKYIYYYYSRKLTTKSLDEIGALCSNAYHASVLYGYRKFSEYKVNDDFIKRHNKCVKAINSTKVFDKIEELEYQNKVSVDVLLRADGKLSKKKFKEYITNIFFSSDISDDMMQLSQSQIIEMRDYRIKPFLLMHKNNTNDLIINQ